MRKWLIYWALGVVGAFLLTPGALALLDGATFWGWRRQIVLLTGFGGLACMALAIVLATRLPWVDRTLHGLDKAYALHKWAGIGAAVLLSAHWLAENAGRWLVQWGLILGGAGHGHGPAGHGPGHGHGGHNPWMGLARELGEWAFYALLVLAAVALISRIPYRAFRWVHRALAVVFLAGAYHSVMLMPASWFAVPAGWLTLGAALAGSAAALWSLAGKIGEARRHTGRIEQFKCLPNGVMEIEIGLPGAGLKSAAGQFVFLTFDQAEGQHPFTIASSRDEGRRLHFAIKPLGDYTRTLSSRLRVGQVIELEGPYGGFDFVHSGDEEVWVAGGIGITPFLARMETLAAQGGSARPIHFWYCTQTRQDGLFPAGLEALCQRAGVILHRWVAEDGQVLTAEVLGQALVKPARAAVWFCGPKAFARALKRGLQRFGLPEKRFHAECFSMR